MKNECDSCYSLYNARVSEVIDPDYGTTYHYCDGCMVKYGRMSLDEWIARLGV